MWGTGQWNLKKVLGMVLCLAMMLSIMVVGAGAAFADQDQIDTKHQEAVDIAVALKIIDGIPRDDGSTVFKPTTNVTREQMAKMICVLDNGGKDPQGATGNTFSDVAADRWSNKYIEACAARGVVAGVGGGKFNPGGDVTGSQAAKMLLVELGYKEDIQKYTGSGWDTNVNIDATKNGYYEDLEDIDVSAPLSREHAAQMIWNALQANEVAYSYTLVTNPDGSISSVVTANNKDQYGNNLATLLEDKYGYETELAMVTDVVYDEDDGTYTTFYTFLNDDYTVAQGTDDFDSANDYSDLFGMAVKVVYNDKGDPIAIARDASVALAEGIVNDIDDNDDNDNKITIGDKEYKLDPSDTQIPYVAYLNPDQDIDEMAPYWNVSLIDLDGNGKGDFFVVCPAYVGQISYAGAKNITISGSGDADGSYKLEDNNVYEGADEDNYVLIVKGCNTVANTAENTNEDAVITQLTMDTIKVTGVKADSIQADGSWIDVALFGGSEVNTFSSGTEYDVATVNDIIVAAEETEDSSKDILFIAAVDEFDSALGETKGTVDVKAYFTDGSSDIVTVFKLDGEKLESAAGIEAGALYTYTTSGGQYSIKAVSPENKAGYDTFIENGAAYVDDPATLAGQKIADAAVIFVAELQTNGSYSVDVISGKDLMDCSSSEGDEDYADVLIGKTSGINYVQVGALICAESPYSTSDTMYGYVVSEPYATQIQDGDDDIDVMTFDVWTGEKVETLNAQLDDFDDDVIFEGAAISYEIEDDLYAQNFASGTMVAITGFEAKSEGTVLYYECDADTELVTSDITETDMDEDVVFIGISSDDYDSCTSITMSNVKVANDEENGIYPNAYIFIGDDDTIVAIFYDIANELVDEEGGETIFCHFA